MTVTIFLHLKHDIYIFQTNAFISLHKNWWAKWGLTGHSMWFKGKIINTQV